MMDCIIEKKIKHESKVSLGVLNIGGCEGDSMVTEEALSQNYNNDYTSVLSS